MFIDDLKNVVGTIIVFAFVVFFIFALCGVWQRAHDQSIAIEYCEELGYQWIYEKNDTFYCVTIGQEPRIMRLATIEELKGK